MMKKYILSLLLLLPLSISVATELVVIGHLSSDEQTLTILQVQSIFMGRNRSLPNGVLAFPLDQSVLRTKFYQQLTLRPIAQIDAYWARLRFSGQRSPPKKLSNDELVIKMIQDNEGAIGYIDKINVDETKIQVLLVLN